MQADRIPRIPFQQRVDAKIEVVEEIGAQGLSDVTNDAPCRAKRQPHVLLSTTRVPVLIQNPPPNNQPTEQRQYPRWTTQAAAANPRRPAATATATPNPEPTEVASTTTPNAEKAVAQEVPRPVTEEEAPQTTGTVTAARILRVGAGGEEGEIDRGMVPVGGDRGVRVMIAG